MKKKYLTYPRNSKKFYSVLVFFFLLFFSYGIYKNGLVYFFNKEVQISSIYPFFLFFFIGIVESFGYAFLRKEKKDFRVLLRGMCLALLVPPSTPIGLFVVCSLFYFLILFLSSLFLPKISTMNLYKIFLILGMFLMNIPLCNVIESYNSYLYGTLDVFFGRGLGGFGTTSIFLLILCYFYLSTDYYYKKEMPIYALSSYAILFFLFFLSTPSSFFLKDFFNPSIFFLSIFFLPQNEVSPVSKKGQVIYSVGVGCLSFLFIHFLGWLEGAFLAFGIVNLLYAVGSVLLIRHFSTKETLYKS